MHRVFVGGPVECPLGDDLHGALQLHEELLLLEVVARLVWMVLERQVAEALFDLPLRGGLWQTQHLARGSGFKV